MKRFLLVVGLVALSWPGTAAGQEPNIAGSPLEEWVKKLKDPDVKIRLQTASFLGGYINGIAKPALPALLEALKDPDDSFPLGYLKPADLIGDLKSPLPSVRRSAAIGLGNQGAGDKLTRTALQEALKDRFPWVRTAAAEAIIRTGGDPVGLLPILSELTVDVDTDLQQEAGRILQGLGDGAVAALVASLADNDPRVRHKAAVTLGFISQSRNNGVAPLVRCLVDEDPQVQAAAAVALKKLWGIGVKMPLLQKALEGADEKLRVQAFAFFGQSDFASIRVNPVNSVLPLLNKALGDPQPLVRIHAAAAICRVSAPARPQVVIINGKAEIRPGKLNRPDLIKVLMEGCGDKDPKVRSQALTYLGHFHASLDEEAAKKSEEIRKEALRDPDLGVRVRAAYGLNLPDKRDAIHAVLVEGLKAADDDTRKLALLELTSQTGSMLPPAETLGGMLGDSNPVIRQHAAYFLGRPGNGTEPALDALTELLKSDSALLRALAAEGIEAIGPKAARAVPALAAALQDDEAMVRFAAAMALGKIGPEAAPAVAAVVSLLENPVPGFQRKPPAPFHPIPLQQVVVGRPRSIPAGTTNAGLAMHILGQIGPKAAAAVPALAKQLRERNLQAIGALQRIGGPGIPALVEGFKHDDLRLPCIVALGAMGPDAREAVPALAQILSDKSLPDKSVDSRVQAAFVLGQMGPASLPALPDLEKALKAAEPELRAMAAQAIGAIGAEARTAVPALAKGLADSDASVRQWSAHALGDLGDAARDVVPQLEKLRDDPDAVVRRSAQKAVLRIAASSK